MRHTARCGYGCLRRPSASVARSMHPPPELRTPPPKLMDTPDDFVGPTNLGNPGEFTIKELADLIIKMTGSRSIITYHALPSDDPKQRKPDIKSAELHLDWKPTIDLENGLNSTIEYFKKVLDATKAT